MRVIIYLSDWQIILGIIVLIMTFLYFGTFSLHLKRIHTTNQEMLKQLQRLSKQADGQKLNDIVEAEKKATIKE